MKDHDSGHIFRSSNITVGPILQQNFRVRMGIVRNAPVATLQAQREPVRISGWNLSVKN